MTTKKQTKSLNNDLLAINALDPFHLNGQPSRNLMHVPKKKQQAQ